MSCRLPPVKSEYLELLQRMKVYNTHLHNLKRIRCSIDNSSIKMAPGPRYKAAYVRKERILSKQITDQNLGFVKQFYHLQSQSHRNIQDDFNDNVPKSSRSTRKFNKKIENDEKVRLPEIQISNPSTRSPRKISSPAAHALYQENNKSPSHYDIELVRKYIESDGLYSNHEKVIEPPRNQDNLPKKSPRHKRMEQIVDTFSKTYSTADHNEIHDPLSIAKECVKTLEKNVSDDFETDDNQESEKVQENEPPK